MAQESGTDRGGLGRFTLKDANIFLLADALGDIEPPGEHSIPRGVIHLERTRFLWSGQLYERLKITNFSGRDAQLPLTVRFGADFADIFEVYPVACIPQAWSCGSVFMLLQACLGLEIDGRRKEVRIEQPLLPIGIEVMRLSGIAVGDARIDLSFQRVQQQVIVAPVQDQGSGVQVYVHL